MEMERSRFASYRRIVARGRHITLTSNLPLYGITILTVCSNSALG